MEAEFLDACFHGHLEEIQTILKAHADFNVNCFDDPETKFTGLHWASDNNHAAVVACLLGHPRINVNVKNIHGETPLFLCFAERNSEVVQLLLQDHRVLLNEPDLLGNSILSLSSLHGKLTCVKWLIACGKDLDLGAPGNQNDAYGAAQNPDSHAPAASKFQVAALLQLFKENSVRTRHAVRLELGYIDDAAAGIFAHIVFLCDGLLSLKPKKPDVEDETDDEARRFLAIVSRLPMEIQMTVCCRAVGSMKVNVRQKNCEAAFKNLAREMA